MGALVMAEVAGCNRKVGATAVWSATVVAMVGGGSNRLNLQSL